LNFTDVPKFTAIVEQYLAKHGKWGSRDVSRVRRKGVKETQALQKQEVKETR
jgi:hypothetical protein